MENKYSHYDLPKELDLGILNYTVIVASEWLLTEGNDTADIFRVNFEPTDENIAHINRIDDLLFKLINTPNEFDETFKLFCIAVYKLIEDAVQNNLVLQDYRQIDDGIKEFISDRVKNHILKIKNSLFF